jgi:hypothetical protein
VAAFIDHMVSGMIESLEGTGKINKLHLIIEGDIVDINLNGVTVPVNTFTGKIIRATIIGMVSPLKGVNGAIKKLSIVLNK